MDRYDESKHVRDRDEDDERNRDRDERPADTPAGGVLGLGGSPVPKMPGDPSAADEAQEEHRHVRGLDNLERSSGADDAPQSSGATGIDMGGGGTGTDMDRD